MSVGTKKLLTMHLVVTILVDFLMDKKRSDFNVPKKN